MRKRIIALTVLLTISIFATGCGIENKKLVCTQSTSGVDITFNVGFKGKIIDNMDFSYNMDLSKYSDTQIKAIEKQDFCTGVKNSMSSYKDAFTDCKQSITNKKLNVNSVLDVNKIAKTALGKMSSPEKAKKELEAQGYSCTIN